MSRKNRQQRKDHVISHLALIQSEYAKDIQLSIVNTEIYEPGSARLRRNYSGETENVIVAKDVVSAIKGTEGTVAILDFASFKNPGGGFVNGSLAQEEAICAESTLYPVLASFEGSYYVPNRTNTRKGLYTDRAMYVPGIVFIRDEKFFGRSDVIVAAAPNRRAAMDAGVDPVDCSNALKERIDTVMTIAVDNGVDTLIAGAYGCGVFGNDPEEVAGMFKKWVEDHSGAIKKVIYAIPGKGESNYEGFVKVFGEDSIEDQ